MLKPTVYDLGFAKFVGIDLSDEIPVDKLQEANAKIHVLEQRIKNVRAQRDEYLFRLQIALGIFIGQVIVCAIWWAVSL